MAAATRPPTFAMPVDSLMNFPRPWGAPVAKEDPFGMHLLPVQLHEAESKDYGGARVDKGSSVSIVVAKAPPDVAVPDVLDQDEESARGALTEAGFRVRVRRQDVDDEAQDGMVIDQNPAGGEERPQDTRVTIVVGRFVPPPEATPPPAEATPTVTPEVP